MDAAGVEPEKEKDPEKVNAKNSQIPFSLAPIEKIKVTCSYVECIPPTKYITTLQPRRLEFPRQTRPGFQYKS